MDDAFQIVREEMDVVADEEGRGGEAGHDLDVKSIAVMVEEDIVAVASFAEMMHHVVHRYLDEICQSVRIGSGLGDDVQLSKPHPGACGGIESDSVLLADGKSFELLGGEKEFRVQIGEAHKLHVWVSEGASGQGTEILEKKDSFVFSGIDHLLPVLQGKADESTHVLRRIVWHVRMAASAFDDDELICSIDDIVFVSEQYDISAGIDDVFQMLYVTEGAGSIFIDNVFRLLASQGNIEANEIDFHRELL